MNGKRKQYSNKFKARVALEAIKGDKTIAELSSMYGIHTSQIMKWKKKVLENIPEIFSNKREDSEKGAEEIQDELYKQIGQLKVELDWLKKKSGFGY